MYGSDMVIRLYERSDLYDKFQIYTKPIIDDSFFCETKIFSLSTAGLYDYKVYEFLTIRQYTGMVLSFFKIK